MSLLQSITPRKPDPIFGLAKIYREDKNPQKVNLGIGVYQDETGKLYEFPSVRQAEKELLIQGIEKEYLPIEGHPEFIKESLNLIYGDCSPIIQSKRVFGAQTVGGTSALRIGAEFLAKFIGADIYIPEPSWPNHFGVFERAGMNIQTYRYYNSRENQIDFEAFCEDVGKIPQNSTILLHGCCHNPTGMDLSPHQWKELSALIKQRGIIPFFDLAYQGLAIGIDADAYGIRLLAEEGHPMLVASSHSKNFGLYCERVGMLSIVGIDPENALAISSQAKALIRACYSNPPLFGAAIITKILQDPALKQSWLEELKTIRKRLIEIRSSLVQGLAKHQLPLDFEFISRTKGLFALTGLTLPQILELRSKYSIYLLDDGRINIAGLNSNNIEYIVHSIASVFKS